MRNSVAWATRLVSSVEHPVQYDQGTFENGMQEGARPYAVNATMTAPLTVNSVPGSIETPISIYTSALAGYEGSRLREISQEIGATEPLPRASALPGLIADLLADDVSSLYSEISPGARLCLGLFAMVEAPSWPAEEMLTALRALGASLAESVGNLLSFGLLVLRPRANPSNSTTLPPYPLTWPPADNELLGFDLLVHPAANSVARVYLPEAEPPKASGPVRQIREADGLEPLLHLASLWQILVEAPLRQTQQGDLYKRDRDRVESDKVLTGPITDVLRPLSDPVALWFDLAKEIGLIGPVPETDRIEAAPAEYWAENAVHLPQMIASRWLSPKSRERTNSEGKEVEVEGEAQRLALTALRPVLLLWIARLGGDAWVAIEDLHSHLLAFDPKGPLAPIEISTPALEKSPGLPKGRGRRAKTGKDTEPPLSGAESLEAILLGPAYLLGLVRAGEEDPSRRRVVQLTDLGRYVLTLGSPPPPKPRFPHFLYVQPNFEMIAYRQGLTPPLIGRLSRFARWSQIGAALTLQLTPESVYQGLESGLTPDQMLEFLNEHAARPLPAGVAEAVRTWAERRERLTYYSSATLIEFPDPESLETALKNWPDHPEHRSNVDEDTNPASRGPVRVSDRLILVENDEAIPYQRFRLAGSRDYRRSPEICVLVLPDGVHLELDISRSDLFIDAELARFADPQGLVEPDDPTHSPRRLFAITAETLNRASREGMTKESLANWFRRRAGTEIPPAIQLLLFAKSRRGTSLKTSRPLILKAPTAEILDGLLQHPATRDYLGDRLGPTDAIVNESGAEALQAALKTLGLAIDLSKDSS